MITLNDLETIAQARLLDAEALITAGRYDGAIYTGGYAIELLLKARICKTLEWADFPDTSQNYRSFRVHDLDVLLHLSGIENKIKRNHMTDWSNVITWDSESRYKTSSASQSNATTMLNSVKRLMTVL